MPQGSRQSQGTLDHTQRSPLHRVGLVKLPQSLQTLHRGGKSPAKPLQGCTAAKGCGRHQDTPILPPIRACTPKASPHLASAAGAAALVSPDAPVSPDVVPHPAFFSRIRSSSCRTRSRWFRRSELVPEGTGGSCASAVTFCRRLRSPARSSWVGRGHTVRAGLAHPLRNTKTSEQKAGLVPYPLQAPCFPWGRCARLCPPILSLDGGLGGAGRGVCCQVQRGCHRGTSSGWRRGAGGL